MPLGSCLRNVKERLNDFFSVSFTRKISLVLVLIFTSIAVIDSTIVKISIYGETEYSISFNVVLFISLYLVFATIGIILLCSVRKNILKPFKKLPIRLRHFHGIIIAVHILMVGIIVALILQMMLLNKYDLRLIQYSTLLTHLSAIFFLIVLVSMFARWLKSRRNSITMLYMISFSLISISVITSLVYLEYQYSFSNSQYRKPYPIQSYVERQEIRPLSEILATVFDSAYVFSFITMWLATALLLSQYKNKLGRIKYFTILGIPLIYYLFTFEGYFGNLFSFITIQSPVDFGVTYVLAFSATKQVGAFLFALAFLSASTLVPKDIVSKSLLISAIGVSILFGSIEISTLQYRLYPPFGLITEAFVPIGSFLVLVGIFTSATNVAQDAQLRRDFYKNAKSQLGLLKTIGVTQMEKELLTKFKSMEKRAVMSGEIDESYSEEEDVKEIVREALNELHSRDRGNNEG